MASVKKHFSQQINRLNQALSQSIGRSEKSEILTEDLQHVGNRVETMVDALKHTRKKLSECLRSKKAISAKEDLEKRRNAFEEYKLSQAVYNEAKEMDASFGRGLLSDVMTSYAEVLCGTVHEMVNYEVNVEHTVLDKLNKFSEEMEIICQQKDKLKKLVLDMDSSKSRLNAAQSRGDERIIEIQDEFDSAYSKVESSKDAFLVDLYTLAAKEVEMAELYRMLLRTQIDYHKRALSRLEATEPVITKKIDTYSRRPVYGCPLEDHLRYSSREIALVLDVCCTALLETGLKDEGLFRIPGNATKVRKLKAQFDSGETEISEVDRDPHAIAGALKQYLRELPDPLMNGNVYNDWVNALNVSDVSTRLFAVRDVIQKLPPSYYANLRYLVKFMAKLTEYQAHTKMSSQNLAIVMAPNMIWNSLEGDGFGLSSTHGALVELLVANANFFFPGDTYSAHLRGSVVSPLDNVSNNSDVGYTGSRQSTLSVDVSLLSSSRGSPDEFMNFEKQNSPSKSGPRKPKPPAPPPPPSASASSLSPHNTGLFREQRTTRSSFHGLDTDRSAAAKLVDINISDPGSAGSASASSLSFVASSDSLPEVAKSGHRKSNSLDRPPVRPPLPNSEVMRALGHEGAESDFERVSAVSSESQYLANPPLPGAKGAVILRGGGKKLAVLGDARNSAMNEATARSSSASATTVRVTSHSDDENSEHDVEPPVVVNADQANNKFGRQQRNTTLPPPNIVSSDGQTMTKAKCDLQEVSNLPPTSPKEVSYVTVIGELEQNSSPWTRASGVFVGDKPLPPLPPPSVLPVGPAPRPKPPVPTKPRALESPDKESITSIRL